MNHTITTTLESSIYSFLQKQSDKSKRTKKSIIEEALRLYKKQELKKQVEAGLSERYCEYKEINTSFHNTQINSIKT